MDAQLATSGTSARLNLAAGEIFYAGNNPLNMSGGAIAGVDFSNESQIKIVDPVEREHAASTPTPNSHDRIP